MRSRKSSVSGRASSTRSFAAPRRAPCERITGGASLLLASIDELDRLAGRRRRAPRVRLVFAMKRNGEGCARGSQDHSTRSTQSFCVYDLTMKRSGVADLALHGGRVPPWLATRMVTLGTAIAESVMYHYGRSALLSRLSDPF